MYIWFAVQRSNPVVWIYLPHFSFRLLTLLRYKCSAICLLDPGWDWQVGMYAWWILASTVTTVCAAPNSLAGIPVLLRIPPILLYNSLYFCWSANQDHKTFMFSWFPKRFLFLIFFTWKFSKVEKCFIEQCNIYWLMSKCWLCNECLGAEADSWQNCWWEGKSALQDQCVMDLPSW